MCVYHSCIMLFWYGYFSKCGTCVSQSKLAGSRHPKSKPFHHTQNTKIRRKKKKKRDNEINFDWHISTPLFIYNTNNVLYILEKVQMLPPILHFQFSSYYFIARCTCHSQFISLNFEHFSLLFFAATLFQFISFFIGMQYALIQNK